MMWNRHLTICHEAIVSDVWVNFDVISPFCKGKQLL